MRIELLFLGAVAVLEAGAVIGYPISNQPRMAFIWTCYALATVALAGVRQ